ncbi:hypothetical protein [Paenibacillus daejeonensis]|uniref:hypothetical protein n=1 Tax=Paenibacillus daejeonensis TaxID=135193 RepID=UPI00036B4879|nr:hypothetical protein [Paenibacillus daejeonensis]
MDLYHYYEKERGPFRNLSTLPADEAQLILDQLKLQQQVFASKRSDDYLRTRQTLEARARSLFIQKGGKPAQRYPHYMTLGPCNWLKQWYNEGEVVSIPLDAIDPQIISFTYGDLFPTMRYKDGKPYREKVYTREEIMNVVQLYGWPQVWNHDGSKGPERYIEAQLWDDSFKRYL